ncbi:MAG: hypothetical protein CMI55_00865 [Parcubacteria group bacterium]|nr:hypothetical protein [Parcubacteria group bacterium]
MRNRKTLKGWQTMLYRPIGYAEGNWLWRNVPILPITSGPPPPWGGPDLAKKEVRFCCIMPEP